MHPFLLLLLLLLLLLAVGLLVFVQMYREHFVNKTYALIVADYGSDKEVERIIREAKKHNINKVYVYDKKNQCQAYQADQSYKDKIANVTCVPSKNIGREQESYLRFVVDHYDTLEDVLIFTLSTVNKGDRWPRFVGLLEKKDDMSVFCHPIYGKVKHSFGFRIQEWNGVAQNPAELPFKDWYLQYVGTMKDAEIDGICYNGIFKTTRSQIRNHSLHYYKKLLSQFKSCDDEIGHYFERADKTVFGKSST